MHEMSIALSLWEIALEEAARAGCARIIAVTVQYGQISGIMPDALQMAFQAITRGSIHAGARLELEMVPLRLKCAFCGHLFGGSEEADIFASCPHCGEVFCHIVECGKELALTRIEAE